MAVNSDNQLKFAEGKITEPLTILNAGSEEFPFGSKMVVHIKQTIEGYDHFLPSPGLEKKLKEENVDIDDVITIEKVEKSEKYPYGYFSIKVVEKNAMGDKKEMNKQPTHKSIEKFEKQFEPKLEEQVAYNKGFNDGDKGTDKMGLHELSIRVEKLEKMVTMLSSEAGHKPGDEEIPF